MPALSCVSVFLRICFTVSVLCTLSLLIFWGWKERLHKTTQSKIEMSFGQD